METDFRLHHRPDRVTLRLGSKTSVLSLDTLLYAKSQSHGTVAAFPNGQLRKHSSAAATAAHSRKKYQVLWVNLSFIGEVLQQKFGLFQIL